MKAILFFSILFFSINTHSATIRTAVELNGQEWAQLYDTSTFTLLDIYNACGVSGETCSGSISGTDISGWKWANKSQSIQFVSGVLQAEINGVDEQKVDTSPWSSIFAPTAGGPGILWTDGAVSDAIEIIDGMPYLNAQLSTISVNWDEATGGLDGYVNYYNYFTDELYAPPFYPAGYFLYKGEYVPPIIETPIPASLFLFTPALLGFIGLRRKLFK